MTTIDWTNDAPMRHDRCMNASRSIRIHNPEALHAPTGYSHVAEVRGGTLVYVAGQVGFDREGKLAGDFAAQVEQVFSNLSAALKAAGGSFADVVKLNCYCV